MSHKLWLDRIKNTDKDNYFMNSFSFIRINIDSRFEAKYLGIGSHKSVMWLLELR